MASSKPYKPNWERVTDYLGITGGGPGITDDYQARQPTKAPTDGGNKSVRVRRVGTRSFPVETTDTNPISSAPARVRDPFIKQKQVTQKQAVATPNQRARPATHAKPSVKTATVSKREYGFQGSPTGSSVADDRSGYTTSKSYGRQPGMGNSSAIKRSNLSHQGGSHDTSGLKFFKAKD